MDPLESVFSTADPAFAIDSKGRIVAWNTGAEEVLGHAARDTAGKRCHELLQGIDPFGNRFCDEHCSIRDMVRRHEPVHSCELSFLTASSERKRISVSVFVLARRGAHEFVIVHVLEALTSRPARPESNAPGCGFGQLPSEIPLRSASPLTDRETEVLRMLAAGATTLDIAHRLSISRATVRNHVHHILKKTNAHSRLEAVCFALRDRLL